MLSVQHSLSRPEMSASRRPGQGSSVEEVWSQGWAQDMPPGGAWVHRRSVSVIFKPKNQPMMNCSSRLSVGWELATKHGDHRLRDGGYLRLIQAPRPAEIARSVVGETQILDNRRQEFDPDNVSLGSPGKPPPR